MRSLHLWTFLLSIAAMTVGLRSAESQPEAWRALGRMKAKDYFIEPMQLKLAEAIAHGNEQQTKELIKQGADVNAVGRDEIRPLFWAMAKRSAGEFEILLENGADPNITAKRLVERDRPLSVMELGAIAEDPAYLRSALKHGGNANFSVGYGNRTLIYEAIINERVRNVSLLAEAGADLSHRDTAGESPLMTAAAVNAYDIVYVLLEKGADPSLKNRWGFDLAGRMKKYGTRGIAPGSERWQWYQKVLSELRKQGLME